MNGYLNIAYAQSLLDHGQVFLLPNSKGWILKRRIPNFDCYDGIGIYPLFLCENWNELPKDIDEIKNELVCFSIVTDPFGSFDHSSIKKEFADVFFPFKEHFVTNLSQPLEKVISKHHWRNIKKAKKEIIVERCKSSQLVTKDWIKLYKHLIKIHHIKGIAAFSEKALAKQLEVPGVKIFRGIHKHETVGMLIWYIHNKIGYYHLGASSDIGYRLKTSFALFWESIKYFSSKGLEWLNLGAGAGITDNSTSGLARFKEGWSSDKRTAYFCGKIFNKKRYYEITNTKKLNFKNYFPAYRKDEFK